MHQLGFAVTVYQTIRERIKALEAGIDEATLADTLEGLTDLHEIVATVVRAAVADEALASGLKDYIRSLEERLGRLSERAAERRRIARDAMLEVAIKKITAPDFTLSIRPGSPSVIVVEGAAIPEPYWQPQQPKLNRLKLLADLKSGVAIPGVHLSNPEEILSVRVR